MNILALKEIIPETHELSLHIIHWSQSVIWTCYWRECLDKTSEKLTQERYAKCGVEHM